jgi:hypothetical protein
MPVIWKRFNNAIQILVLDTDRADYEGEQVSQMRCIKGFRKTLIK